MSCLTKWRRCSLKAGTMITITGQKSWLKQPLLAGTHLITVELRSLKTIPPPGGRWSPKALARMLSLNYSNSLYLILLPIPVQAGEKEDEMKRSRAYRQQSIYTLNPMRASAQRGALAMKCLNFRKSVKPRAIFNLLVPNWK